MEVITEKKEDRQMISLLHFSQLLNYISGLGGFIVPLLLWMLKKEEIKNMDAHGKQVLNFQISLFIYFFIGGITTLILIGFVILAVAGIIGIVFPIINGIKANNGENVNYPLSFRFIK